MPVSLKAPGRAAKDNKVLIFLALALNLFAGGVVFGWGALVVVLQRYGIYSWECAPFSESSAGLLNGTTTSTAAPVTTSCTEQLLRLNTVFLCGTFGSMSMSFPSGLFMDKTSPKSTIFLGIFLHVVGAFLFSISSFTLDLYPVGYFLSGAAAPCILLGGVTIVATNVEERRKGFVISILNGCYDASAIVWQVYLWLDNSVVGGVSVTAWFLAYICVVVVLGICTQLIVPGAPEPAQEAVEVSVELPSLSPDAVDVVETPQEAAVSLKDQPLFEQIKSKEFVTFTCFFCVGLLRFSYYIGSVDAQLTWLGQEDGSYTMIFGAILPLGVFSTPFIGTLLDRKGLKAGFMAVYAFKFLHSLIVLLPNIDAQVAGFVTFAIFRGCFFAVASAFLVQTFGPKTFGRIFGISATIGAVFSLLQSPLLALSVGTQNFAISNLIVLGMTLAIFTMHLFVYFLAPTKNA